MSNGQPSNGRKPKGGERAVRDGPLVHQVRRRERVRSRSGVVLSFELVEPARQVGVRREHGAELNERADDLDAGFDGDRSLQDTRQHHGAVFSEDVGQLPAPAPAGL